MFAAVIGAAAHPSTGARGGPSEVEGQIAPSDLKRHIDSLSAFDYPTRMNAARMLRRTAAAEAVPALAAAARAHLDQFVRYRALVLLTSFNDRGTAGLMRTLLTDRNDRVREVAYRWFERNPEPDLTSALLAALETEQSEFVRPALVRAVAALPRDDAVQRALVAEIGRGFDFFRSAVIEALGEHRAAYAVDALAALAATDGPLQDDVVLALGRIGERRALDVVSSVKSTAPDVMAAQQAAGCLLGDACATRIDWLATTAGTGTAKPEAIRAAVAALGAVAQREAAARTALVRLADGASDRVRDEIARALAGVALRQPVDLIGWLAEAPDAQRTRAIDLLRLGFESSEEDFAEEQFFAAARAAYWKAGEGSAPRTLSAVLIDRLEF